MGSMRRTLYTLVLVASGCGDISLSSDAGNAMLTVSRDGNGSGSVTSSPPGIECGSDCSESYASGSSVTLTATPAPGSTFTGWSGECSGTGPCTVTLAGAASVTATFSITEYALTVERTGTGVGTVTSSPAGIDCGSDCTESLREGAQLILTATSGPDGIFAGWGGGVCMDTATTCVVTLDQARTVTAEFTCTGSTTFAYTGVTQTFTVPACATSLTIDAYGAEGGTSTGEVGGLNVLGGRGAYAKGTVPVTAGDVLTILVGGRGTNSNCGSGGGGGTFVARDTTPLIVAGGGGGGFHCSALGAVGGGAGLVSDSGGNGLCTPNRAARPGGTAGNGGSAFYGGGGGGFLTAGTSSTVANAAGRGFPGLGGAPGGGFGGGGGFYTGCCGASGGGGGYSGGSAGEDDGCAGGGGGSFNAGTEQTMTAGVRFGHGLVTITWQ